VKVTGIILILIGLLAGAICMVVVLDPLHPGREAPIGPSPQSRGLSMVVPLAVCGTAILIGAAMYMFGGRSYSESNNPNVRN
jgi:hypothetical protein